MKKPMRVTVLDSSRIIIETETDSDAFILIKMGFSKSNNYNDVYFYKSSNKNDVFKMCERLRDINTPFCTDKNGGAEYAIETFRSRGYLSGRFKRIIFSSDDVSVKDPFIIQDF